MLNKHILNLLPRKPRTVLQTTFSLGVESKTSMITTSSCGCIATQLNGLPITAVSTWPSMRNFLTYREIVFVDICYRKLTLSISKTMILDNQIALHRKSWLYARAACSQLPSLLVLQKLINAKRTLRYDDALCAHSLKFNVLTF